MPLRALFSPITVKYEIKVSEFFTVWNKRGEMGRREGPPCARGIGFRGGKVALHGRST